MKTVPAAKFKEQCLALLDRVGPDGIIITKHGKPVAKLIPIHTETANLIGSFKGNVSLRTPWSVCGSRAIHLDQTMEVATRSSENARQLPGRARA